MLHHLVIGAVITSLNGIGLWHSVPLTGFSPSNGILWRSFSSLEVAASFYGLRYVYPFVFPEDDATIKEDILLQHSIHAQEFETAWLALQHSSKAISLHTNTSRVTTASNDPRTTGMSSSVYLDEELTHKPGKTRTLRWVLLLLGLFGLQIFELKILHDMKNQPSHASLQREIEEVTDQIGWFRQEFNRLIPNLHSMGATFRDAVYNMEQLYNETMESVNLLSHKTTDSMISVDSQLGEIRKKNREMVENTKGISEIPKQFAWLNTLIQKSLHDEEQGRKLSNELAGYIIGATSPGFGRKFSPNSLSPKHLTEPAIRSIPLRPDSKASSTTSSKSSTSSNSEAASSTSTPSTPQVINATPKVAHSKPPLSWNTRPTPPEE